MGSGMHDKHTLICAPTNAAAKALKKHVVEQHNIANKLDMKNASNIKAIYIPTLGHTMHHLKTQRHIPKNDNTQLWYHFVQLKMDDASNSQLTLAERNDASKWQ